MSTVKEKQNSGLLQTISRKIHIPNTGFRILTPQTTFFVTDFTSKLDLKFGDFWLKIFFTMTSFDMYSLAYFCKIFFTLHIGSI